MCIRAPRSVLALAVLLLPEFPGNFSTSNGLTRIWVHDISVVPPSTVKRQKYHAAVLPLAWRYYRSFPGAVPPWATGSTSSSGTTAGSAVLPLGVFSQGVKSRWRGQFPHCSPPPTTLSHENLLTAAAAAIHRRRRPPLWPG